MTDYQDDPRMLGQVIEALDPTQRSTCSSKPNANSKPKPSAKIRGLIGRLGLRYHPANSADLASHQAMLLLLAEDLAHVDPEMLERAINKHVAKSPYMPKASQLIALAQAEIAPRTSLQAYADVLTDERFSRENGWRWSVSTDGQNRKYLDRHDIGEQFVAYQPSELEMRITQEVCAELARDPDLTQAQFAHMVRYGRVSRIVADRLREAPA
jgi:hypothetical protein